MALLGKIHSSVSILSRLSTALAKISTIVCGGLYFGVSFFGYSLIKFNFNFIFDFN